MRHPRRAFLRTAASAATMPLLGVLPSGCGGQPEIPPPRAVPWKMKPLESAQTRLEKLPDGRLYLHIRHDVLRGVTPAMIVWWFRNMDGEMTVDGKAWPRYQIWHPVDHIAIGYPRRRPDGSIGPGAQIHIREAFGGRPEYYVDIISTIEKLDETGFVHVGRMFGTEVARLAYTFTPTPQGTLYENSLTAGRDSPLARLLLNTLVLPFALPEHKARAWLRHNVEEVGSFEHFLPALFAGRPAPAAR